jgi:hypothetical protein
VSKSRPNKPRRSNESYAKGPRGGVWNSRGVRKRRTRESMPSQLDNYGGKRLRGLDYGVKNTVTNSFEPDKTVPPPKGGFPENKTATKRIQVNNFNSRRG